MDEMKTEIVQISDALENDSVFNGAFASNEHGVPAGVKADDLPDETLNDFSNAPLEFEETALMVTEDTQRLYYHAGTANRFSENYLKYCAQLESYIRKAGTLCLVKAVLEQKGNAFPKLEGLSIHELVRMVSFHARKCHAAINGLYKDNNKLGLVYLQWELRWINLCDRLKATAAKIEKVKTGEISADSLIEREETVRNQPCSNENGSTGLPQSLQINPKALPMDRSMAAEMMHQKQSLERQQRQQKREQRSLERDMGYQAFEPDLFWLEQLSGGTTPAGNKHPEEHTYFDFEPPEVEDMIDDDPIEYIPEDEARRILIEDATRRGDRKALAEIPMEDAVTFRERWMRRMDELEHEIVNRV